MSDEERAYLMSVARRALGTYFESGRELEVTDVPRSLRRFDKRVVFATFHMDGDTRGCISASEKDIGTNVVKAVIRTAHDDRYSVKDAPPRNGKPVTLRNDEVSKVRIELNVLGNYDRLAFNDADSLRGEVEPGVHGVRLAQGKNSAYYLPYVGIEFEYDIVPYLRTLAHKAKLKPDAWQKKAALWRFESVNFVEGEPGRAIPLYRWNTPTPAPTLAELDAAISRATAFVETTLRDPTTELGWHPKRKKGLGEAAPWQRARAATVLRSATRSASAPPTTRAVDTKGAGLAMTLAWRCAGGSNQSSCDELAGLVDPSGRLAPAARTRLDSWEREHHDVVATLRALAAQKDNARWGAAAQTMLLRAIEDYGARAPAWAELATAALALRAADPRGPWLEHARTFGSRVLAMQLRSDTAPTPDQRGALLLGQVPSTADAARAALAFARLAMAGAPSYRGPALDAARFLLSMQYRPDNAFAFPDIPRYLGGVRPNLHHVSAHTDSTLDALEAWGALAELLRSAPAPAR
jgi:uncharacterized protein (TIGR00296 family)